MARSKKFIGKMHYDAKHEKLIEWQKVQDAAGKLVGSTLMFADPDRDLPRFLGQPGFVEERLVEIIVHPRRLKSRGEITLLKKSKREANAHS